MAAMASCPACHADNPEGARFCATCGAGLVSLQAREVRKTITVLFADVTGSTALGEQLDPETMRSIMGRYFTMMKGLIEHHGGTVEKFIGDAVMAVFGIPAVHEDDALRAVRAAADIKTELARLNAELEASRGIAIRFRTGINTGEVVAGGPVTSQTLVTGDTVNVAARLEQHAPPGEILLGALTWSLVRDAVAVEPFSPIAAKGKAAPVAAWRLVRVHPGEAGRRRRLDAPLVGRERELARLEQAFRQAVADGASGLFTLLGSAGIGKSRLVAEFTGSLSGEATVLRGHCLSYGEGITYWPIGEIVRSAAGIDESDTAEAARAKLRAVLGAERDADVLAARISSAIGLSTEAVPQEEIFWAIRKLLEHLARERALVVVVEDIHWAEPTLLDLLEHIVDWSRDAPFLLLCPARPELLELRPGWGGGKLNATTVLLEALAAVATARLIAALPGGAALPEPVIERIAAAAEGNPLYLEEMLAMLVDDGLLAEAADGTWSATAELAAVRVPASISALLAARLEQLTPAERAVAERASVVGRVFEAAAVSELADEDLRPAVGVSLLALVRKELVRPERSELSAGDAFRFRHILIRDAAYAALPKADRAALHERFADWRERTAGERLPELEEIVGHHLEQAHRYRSELGETGPALERLGERAGERLAAAAMGARERADAPATVRIGMTAAFLLPLSHPMLRELMPAVVRGLTDLGEFAKARAVNEGLRAEAAAANDSGLVAWTDVLGWGISAFVRDELSVDPSTEELLAARSKFENVGDFKGVAAVDRIRAGMAWINGRMTEAARIFTEAAESADVAGEARQAARSRADSLQVLGMGPERMSEISRAALEQLALGPDPVARAFLTLNLAVAEGSLGAIAAAREHYAEGRSSLIDLGHRTWALISAQLSAQIELQADNATGAAEILADSLRELDSIGERNYLSTTAAILARVLCDLGEWSWAREAITMSRSASSPDDLVTEALWRSAEARWLANQGELISADRSIQAALDILARTDMLMLQAMVWEDAASVAASADREVDQRLAITEALIRYRIKEDVVSVARLEATLRHAR